MRNPNGPSREDVECWHEEREDKHSEAMTIAGINYGLTMNTQLADTGRIGWRPLFIMDRVTADCEYWDGVERWRAVPDGWIGSQVGMHRVYIRKP